MMKIVNGKYIQKGAAVFHLLQECDCRLIVNIKLTNLEGKTMSRFLAWAGRIISDQPFVSKVNETKDRTNQERSNMMF